MQEPTVIPSQEPEVPQKSAFWHDVWEIAQTLLLALILYFAIDAVFARVRVDNISMEKTLMPGDLLVVNKLAYKLGTYQTGDVVIFHNPLNVKEDFIKRLIGKPGDTVSVHNGKVSVNGVVCRRRTSMRCQIMTATGSFPKIRFLCWEITGMSLRIPTRGDLCLPRTWSAKRFLSTGLSR